MLVAVDEVEQENYVRGARREVGFLGWKKRNFAGIYRWNWGQLLTSSKMLSSSEKSRSAGR